MINLFFLIISFYVVIKSADRAVFHSSKLAEGLRIPKYLIGFLLVAIISALPETFISINSALQGSPDLGLGTLFGSNTADLTLIFGLVILISGRPIKVGSRVISNKFLHVSILFIPIFFGLDGYYSKIEGFILIFSGVYFYYKLLRHERARGSEEKRIFSFSALTLFVLSVAVLLLSSNLTVKYAITVAHSIHINPVLIGMFFVGLGTTLPELFFSVRAVKENHDGLAIGDILGTVITDATILVGIMAIIKPFAFNVRIVYVTGMFMILAVLVLFYFIKSSKTLTKKEAFLLIAFYLLFMITEITVGEYFHYIYK